MLPSESPCCAVILAAGEGKRMRSAKPKVLSTVLQKPMLQWVLDATKGAGIKNLCVVAGFQHEKVETFLAEYNAKTGSTVTSVLQTERLGTAHAVSMAKDFLQAYSGGNVLVLSGDAPFITSQMIQDALTLHQTEKNAVTVISAPLQNPFGYGRIVRDRKGKLTAIVEEKDATAEQKQIQEVNSGSYWFAVDALLSVLPHIQNQNAQGEYYLPDAVKLFLEDGAGANAYEADDDRCVLGANDCMQLNQLNQLAQAMILQKHMGQGVLFPAPQSVIIDPDVTIGRDVTILPSVVLLGNTVVADGCTLGPCVSLCNVTVAEGVSVSFLEAKDCTLP